MSDNEGKKPGDKAAERVGTGCGIGCVGMVVVMVLFFVWALSGGGDSDPARERELEEFGAIDTCEGWVRDQLKAPSTAEFNDSQAIGAGPWTVTGTVDAENSFGAMIRHSWTCEIRLDGDMFRGSATVTE